jgi:hypothetical protein
MPDLVGLFVFASWLSYSHSYNPGVGFNTRLKVEIDIADWSIIAAKLLFLTPVVVIFDSSIGAASPSLSLSLGQQRNIPYPAVPSIYPTLDSTSRGKLLFSRSTC